MMARLFFCLLATTLLIGACDGSKSRGPYVLQEVIDARLPLPLYYLDPDGKGAYSQLNETIYYFDLGDDLKLDIYFTILNSAESATRVSRITICAVCGLIGPTDEVIGKDVPISWAAEGIGSTCKVLSYATRNEFISGEAYQSCFFWMDEQGYKYKVYTIWPDDEAVKFINSLQKSAANTDSD